MMLKKVLVGTTSVLLSTNPVAYEPDIATKDADILKDLRDDINAEINMFKRQMKIPVKKRTKLDYCRDQDKWVFWHAVDEPLYKLKSDEKTINKGGAFVKWENDVQPHAKRLVKAKKAAENMKIKTLMKEKEVNEFVADCQKKRDKYTHTAGEVWYFYHGSGMATTIASNVQKNGQKAGLQVKFGSPGFLGKGIYMSSNFFLPWWFATEMNGANSPSAKKTRGIFRLLACLTGDNVLPIGIRVKKWYKFKTEPKLSKDDLKNQVSKVYRENFGDNFVTIENKIKANKKTFNKNKKFTFEQQTNGIHFKHSLTTRHPGGEWTAIHEKYIRHQAVFTGF